MRKNVASQRVGAQMVSATDGSAFTGSVTVAVTLDAGTQATGTVGSGACTHEGNGYHTYAPSQAETNGDLVAFTFTGTGAIPVTVQIYTSFPQTGDGFARLGAPAGASVSADVAAVKSDTGTTLTRIGTPSNLGGGATIAANLSDIEAQTDDIGVAGAGLTALGDTRLANLDAAMTSRSTFNPATDPVAVVSLVNALAADAIDSTAVATSGATEIANATLGAAVEGTVTVKQSLQLSNAASAGIASGMATTTATLRGMDDSTNRIVATVDADGNRTAVTRTFS